MQQTATHDTICAIATPPGTGAIAVIRVSGPQAISVANSVLHLPKGRTLTNAPANTVHYGWVNWQGEPIDEVLATLFRGPHSYTGEDTVEISCHGSPFIQQRVLEVLIAAGARMAEPGEFTLQAFLNAKMDLSQAEGVADLIAAHSQSSKQLALQQMKGGFSAEINKLRQELLHFISLLELELDFSEEDVEFADRTELAGLIRQIVSLLRKLTDSFHLGNVLKNGVPVVIAGAPNAGKSTLLNALLNEERAIVSEIAGTTRDTIEDVIRLQGISFRFIDTAGLRETRNAIEAQGIERTHSKMEEASIVILLMDARLPLEDLEEQMRALKDRLKDTTLIGVINKVDLLEAPTSKIPQWNQLGKKLGLDLLTLSAKSKTHLPELEERLLQTVQYTADPENDVIVSNVRHQQALNQALEALNRALQGLETGLSGDFLAQDVREALHFLGEITGEVTTDDILGNIFKNFCIGK